LLKSFQVGLSEHVGNLTTPLGEEVEGIFIR